MNRANALHVPTGSRLGAIITMALLLAPPWAVLADGKVDLHEKLEEYLNPELPPVHKVVWDGDLEQLEKLLAAGADVNATVEKWGTPLHVAAHRNRPRILRALLAAGADLKCRGQVRPNPDRSGIRISPKRGIRGLDVGRRCSALVEYLRGRANEGGTLAQLKLAQMYIRGDRVERDYVLARRWGERAAEDGYVPAQLLLADLLTRGPAELRDV